MKKFAAVLAMLVTTTSSAAFSADLSHLFNRDMVGATIAYFEHKAGPAWQKYGTTRVYKVDGCKISVEAPGETVVSLSVDLSEKCSFDASEMREFGNVPRFLNVSFGTIEAKVGRGEFYSDCLYMCGNAYDPAVFMIKSGSRANQWLDVIYRVRLVGTPAYNAGKKWLKAMTDGWPEEDIVFGKYKCLTSFNDVAAEAFHDIAITEVTMGTSIADKYRPEC